MCWLRFARTILPMRVFHPCRQIEGNACIYTKIQTMFRMPYGHFTDLLIGKKATGDNEITEIEHFLRKATEK